MKSRNTRQKRITERLDRVQAILESNTHLKDQPNHNEICELLDALSLWFPHMSDEDKDYYQCACYAVGDNRPWNL